MNVFPGNLFYRPMVLILFHFLCGPLLKKLKAITARGILSGGGGGGDRGVTISRLPYSVLPPPVCFYPFVSRLPPFIVFLPLSCKSRCLTPYLDSNRECFGLVQNKKLCGKSNHSALSSAIIEAAFLRHKQGG